MGSRSGSSDALPAPRDRRSGRAGRKDHDIGAGRVPRAMEVLELLGTGALGVVEIARALGREKSQVSRLLRLLDEAGLVDREPGTRRYRVGTRLFAIGAGAIETRLRSEAEVLVARDARALGERVDVCVRRGGVAVTVCSAAPDNELHTVGWAGRTMPLACTAVGRALMFDLDAHEIAALVVGGDVVSPGPDGPRSFDDVLARVEADRRRGTAVARQETDRGLVALAVPARDSAGRIVAAVGASGPVSRLDHVADRVGGVLRRAAAQLSAGLGAPAVAVPDPATGGAS